LKDKIGDEETRQKLNKITPLESSIDAEELVIYEFNKNGVIKKLKTYSGIPSDENRLNLKLDESNELFAQLLEIQQTL
jgi:hypothetical protein